MGEGGEWGKERVREGLGSEREGERVPPFLGIPRLKISVWLFWLLLLFGWGSRWRAPCG